MFVWVLFIGLMKGFEVGVVFDFVREGEIIGLVIEKVGLVFLDVWIKILREVDWVVVISKFVESVS